MKNTLTSVLALSLSLTAAWPASAQAPSRRSSVAQSRAPANVLIDLSERLVNLAVAGATNEISDVDDVILGTPVTGKARSIAKTSAELVPDPDNAVVDVFVKGQTLANTIGTPTSQPLYIYATSTTPFIARKRLYFNESGLNGYSAQARAKTSIELEKITDYQGHTDSFRTDIAELGYEAKRPLYEYYTSQKTETKLIDKLETTFKPLITKGNADFARYLKQFRDVGIPLRSYHFSTTETAITVTAFVALPGHEAPIDLPLPAPAPFDVAGRVHQNAINDAFQAVLGGKTFSAEQLESMTTGAAPSLQATLGRQFLGSVSDGNLLKAVSLTFAEVEPITVIFADHGFVLTVNVKELNIVSPHGRSALRLPGLKVRAVYKFSNTPGRVEVVRQGPVQILPFYDHPFGGRILGVVLQNRLNQTFKERQQLPNLPVPSDLSKIGTLAANRGDADRGWVVLTWRQQPPRESSTK